MNSIETVRAVPTGMREQRTPAIVSVADARGGLVGWRSGATALASMVIACSTGCIRAVEDRGPLLAKDAAAGVPNMVWTSDGSEVVYVSESSSGVHRLEAVRLADGLARQVDSAEPSIYLPLARSADGTALYYFTADGTLREAFSGKAIAAVQGAMFTALAASSTGRYVLFWDASRSVPGMSSGSAVLLDVTAGTSIPLAFCGSQLFAFSPSREQGLCFDRTIAAFDIFDVATATMREQHAAYVSAADVRWTKAGPLVAGVLVGDARAVAVEDVSTEAVHVVYRLPAPSSAAIEARDFPDKSIVAGTTLRLDARAVALWKAECLARNFAEPEYCGSAQGSLIVVDVDTGSQTLIASGEATADGGGGSGPITFADDGTQVAYRIGSEIHVRAVHRE